MNEIVENAFKVIVLLATKIFINFSESHDISYKIYFKTQYSQHMYSQCKMSYYSCLLFRFFLQ